MFLEVLKHSVTKETFHRRRLFISEQNFSCSNSKQLLKSGWSPNYCFKNYVNTKVTCHSLNKK